jgi:hypothetical protein
MAFRRAEERHQSGPNSRERLSPDEERKHLLSKGVIEELLKVFREQISSYTIFVSGISEPCAFPTDPPRDNTALQPDASGRIFPGLLRKKTPKNSTMKENNTKIR